MRFATEELNVTSSDLVNVTEAISAGLSLGGANAQEAASSIRQISQAFSKGKLDGDEFRSVMENAGFLMNELRKEMGLSRAELLQWSRDGKLTADILAENFAKISDDVIARLDQMPLTIGQAFQQLENSWNKFLIALNNLGVFSTLISVVKGLTTAINEFSFSVRPRSTST